MTFKKHARAFAFITPLFFAGTAALAQSSPNLVTGQIPTAAQWNSYFASKLDYSGPLAAIATSGSASNLISGTVPVARLPIATTGAIGGVKPDGSTVTIAPDGTISAAAAGSVPCVTTPNSIQYDAAGVLGCVAGVTSDGTTMTFAPSALKLTGSSSGTAFLNAPATGGGVLALPTGADTLVGRVSTDTLTGKSMSGGSNTFTNIPNVALTNSSLTIGSTNVALGATAATIAGLTLTSPTISTIVNTGTLTLPTATDTLVARTTTDTLTNKSMSGSSNTFTNIPNSAFVNASVTVNGTSCTLGSTCTPPAPAGTLTGSALASGVTSAPGVTSINGSTVPTAADTFALLAATQTITNKTLSGASNTINNLNASNISTGTLATARTAVGKSVLDPGTGVLESVVPLQTVTGASKTYATADLQLETRRSNSGTAMTDTLPASGTTGLANGAILMVNNVDTTVIDTVTAGAGTTIGGNTTDVVEAGRFENYVYELSTTTWRKLNNTGNAALFGATGGNVTNDIVTMRSIYGGVQDSGILLSSVALNGTGAVITTSQSPSAADFNTTCKTFTINATSLTITLPAAATLQPNGGCYIISNPSAFSATVTPNAADKINGGTTGASITVPSGLLTFVTTDGINGIFIPLGGASNGFPITLGSTSITAGSSNATINGLTLGTSTALGTPASGNLANATGYPVASLAGLGSGVGTLLGGSASGTGGPAGSASPTFSGTVNAAALILSSNLTTNVTGSTQCLNVNTLGVVSGFGGPCSGVQLSVANVWAAQQSNAVTTLTIATATFTPDGSANNYKIGMTSACPCTLANPSVTPVAGTAGLMEVDQDATGSRTFGTYGSQYSFPGGTSTLTLSTAANAVDYVPFYVKDATHIVLSPPILNPIH